MDVPAAEVIKLAKAVLMSGLNRLVVDGNESAFLVLGLLNADKIHLCVLEGAAPRMDPRIRPGAVLEYDPNHPFKHLVAK